MEQYDSNINQDIKRQFTDREIYAPAGIIVDFILKKSFETSDAPFSIDDISNLFYFQDADGNQHTEPKKEMQIASWKDELEEAEEELPDDDENAALISHIAALHNDIETLENAESTMKEIYEWWIVSSFLARKLENYGESILTDGQNHYWGRCTTGQAILLDDVISRICSDMEILHGQRHAWK